MIAKFFRHRAIMTALFIVNALGTVYGYYWYRFQLEDTPAHFYIFVPDSPTASLFFTIVLGLWLIGKHNRWIEALALVTMFKYGIWAVVMNVLTWAETGSLSLTALMLVFSHGAMAIEAILYSPFYRFTVGPLLFAAVWTLHNDVIDYVFGQLPRYPALDLYVPEIGYFTFWLSMLSILVAYAFGVKNDRLRRSLPL
ncbi:DUF1405 domain-containing protein [Bacillaceae bacterium SIJ1]|uniref:DUF1405 domain-containing protein n=1 Tax=Litoribacterium kuwaitense TaxID=1398745 RepID=UPI0013ED0738|nr:DUF1405 domain-containing protein [Litoribacterium kuwaitense]NGP43725.1 DUF1405 domain-containing protein [Litoribacterium kuwaitense]